MIQRALVTGATGYVGARLAARLGREGVAVTALVREGSSTSALELPDTVEALVHPGSAQALVDAVTDVRPDAVFHVAGRSSPRHGPADVAPLVASNVLLTAEVLEAAAAAGAGCFVNTGSYWQHARGEEASPNSLYAATKEAACDLVRFYAVERALPAVSLLLYDVYGPDDPRPKLFNLLRDAARSGRAVDMTAGDQQIDAVHVDDVCEAYVVAARSILEGRLRAEGQAYAVATGVLRTVREVVALYREMAGGVPEVRWGARPYGPGQIMTPWLGPTLPGWTASVRLEEGLAALLPDLPRR